MSTQKFPSAWINASVTGRSSSVRASTPVESHWWDDLSDASKEEYVAEHPNSKYADMHRDSKDKKAAEPSKPKADDQPAAPKHTPEPEQDKSHAAHESLKSEELKPKSPLRTKLADYLKSRPKAVWSHLKHEGQEFKTAGKALAGLARGKPLDAHDKKALASVAADLAIVTVTLITGGHAAHGLAAFFSHGGTHLAQECLIKSAVKGAMHHASVVAFTVTGGTDESMESIIEGAVKLMAEALESGDLQKYVDEADKEGKAAPSKAQPIAAKITARIDMSADVAGKGLCPECKKPMSVVTSGASKMWACAADRISFPVPNGYGTSLSAEATVTDALNGR